MNHPGLARTRSEIENGRLWKARDRVSGLFSSDPTNQDVLRLAGEVYCRMGDLPRAGAFWFLTDLSGVEVDAAMAALDERFPNPVHLAAYLPIRDRIDTYPAAARARLEGLQRAVTDETGRAWNPPQRERLPAPPASTSMDLAGAVGCVVSLVALGMFAIGFIAVVSAVVSEVVSAVDALF